jgi:hypothetical protein
MNYSGKFETTTARSIPKRRSELLLSCLSRHFRICGIPETWKCHFDRVVNSEALTRAERDIKQNWAVYRERFLKGEWP